MTNLTVLQGRTTKDLELRFTQTGTPVVSFTLANDTGSGEHKKTFFAECVAWKGTAETLAKFVQKGQMIIVTGELGARQWKDKDGNNRKSVEITVREFSFCGDSKKTDWTKQADDADDYEEVSDELPY